MRPLLALLVLSFTAAHGDPWSAIDTRTWLAPTGLPDDKTNAIVQSREGYLWVAGHGGVASFDGVRFVPVTSPKLPLAGRALAKALCASKKGGVWIAFD